MSSAAGMLAGLALSVGYIAQTIGLQYTDESTSAFITYMLVVFVPLIYSVSPGHGPRARQSPGSHWRRRPVLPQLFGEAPVWAGASR